jgi:pimeloyl-ACP methyl ester carboxylesterase
MAVVLVNGNPETAAIWSLFDALLARDDVARLSPPGFGAPIPPGFECTVTGYRDWLIGELESFPEPPHLVGHDVGGSTVVCVAMARPDLIRSWTSDSLGVFDPDYEWHPLARTWQTPGEGEASVAELLGGSVEERVRRMLGRGIDRAIAEQIAPHQGGEMASAIISFYRSAAQPAMAELGQSLAAAATRPGLAIVGTEDAFVGSVEMRKRSARRAGAQVQILNGIGHWWMVQAPEAAARAVKRFWAKSDRSTVIVATWDTAAAPRSAAGATERDT